MAAEVLANDLGLDLYRIDLSGVVSKYIGETEKNLRRLFDAAEQGGAMLFFDEADALFGKRSEVKDSHDRYANIEVNYLLQRMESYRGLAILATNLRSALDSAFTRRLRFIVPFALPSRSERERIWRQVFPPEVPVDGIDPARLGRLSLSGALIHSIALHAVILRGRRGHAGDDGPRPRRHARRAAQGRPFHQRGEGGMRIELTIEQLVLTGVSAVDADQVRSAIETELVRVLALADPSAFTSGAVPSVRAAMPTTPDAGSTGFGTAVGAALGSTVTSGGRP